MRGRGRWEWRGAVASGVEHCGWRRRGPLCGLGAVAVRRDRERRENQAHWSAASGDRNRGRAAHGSAQMASSALEDDQDDHQRQQHHARQDGRGQPNLIVRAEAPSAHENPSSRFEPRRSESDPR